MDEKFGSNNKERAQALAVEKWNELKELMEGSILPLVEQAKWLPGDVLEKRNSLWSLIGTHLSTLREPHAVERQRKISSGEITPEMLAEEEAKAEERRRVMAEARSQKSDVQKCVDEWLKDKLKEYDLRPDLMKETDVESFRYTARDTCYEHRSGSVSFEVPDLVKERLDDLMEEDFNDALKEYLDERHCRDFTVDLDDYESGDHVDSETELE